MTDAPAVSVVMPVHNAVAYLDASIGSILGQSFTDLELVIRDDGSTDGSREVLQAWAARDPRIRLFHGAQLGPAGSSNWVVEQARAPIIARMDADDIARRDRLERQIALLRQSPDTVLVGSLCTTIDAAGNVVRPLDLWRAERTSPFAPFPHASVMLRRAVFDRVGGYRGACDYWEDLDLCLRVAALGRVQLICEPLILYRQSPASTRLVSDHAHVDRATNRMYRCVASVEQGCSYEHLLTTSHSEPDQLDPRAIISRASTRLWAHQPPRALKALCTRSTLGLNRTSVLALLWAIWAALNPASLRGALRLLYALRNGAVRGRIRRGQIIDWRLPRSPSSTGSTHAP